MELFDEKPDFELGLETSPNQANIVTLHNVFLRSSRPTQLHTIPHQVMTTNDDDPSLVTYWLTPPCTIMVSFDCIWVQLPIELSESQLINKLIRFEQFKHNSTVHNNSHTDRQQVLNEISTSHLHSSDQASLPSIIPSTGSSLAPHQFLKIPADCLVGHYLEDNVHSNIVTDNDSKNINDYLSPACVVSVDRDFISIFDELSLSPPNGGEDETQRELIRTRIDNINIIVKRGGDDDFGTLDFNGESFCINPDKFIFEIENAIRFADHFSTYVPLIVSPQTVQTQGDLGFDIMDLVHDEDFEESDGFNGFDGFDGNVFQRVQMLQIGNDFSEGEKGRSERQGGEKSFFEGSEGFNFGSDNMNMGHGIHDIVDTARNKNMLAFYDSILNVSDEYSHLVKNDDDINGSK